MPRFAANLSLLYTELPFLDRFEAAARDGFEAVEYLFPYAFDLAELLARLKANGLQQVLFNAPPGGTDAAGIDAAWAAGARGTACVPGREAEFRAGVIGALDHVRQNFENEVLLVSSGGPIATAVAHVLDAPFEASIELNLRIRNTAVTEFAFNPKRHQLITYNTLPHLDAPPYRDWLTHA